jgi:hypothetical protein
MFKVLVDSKEILSQIEQLNTTQIPYATSQAINAVAKLATAAAKKNVEDNLKFHQKSWVLGSIRQIKFAKPEDPMAIIIVMDAAAVFLNSLEKGLERTAPDGTKGIWLPNAQVWPNMYVPRSSSLAPWNLKFTKQGNRWTANDGVFMVNSKRTGLPLILQYQGDQHASTKGQLNKIKRQQRGRDDKTKNRVLFTMVRRVKTPVRIQWYNTLTQTTTGEFPNAIRTEYDKALLTANR